MVQKAWLPNQRKTNLFIPNSKTKEKARSIHQLKHEMIRGYFSYLLPLILDFCGIRQGSMWDDLIRNKKLKKKALRTWKGSCMNLKPK